MHPASGRLRALVTEDSRSDSLSESMDEEVEAGPGPGPALAQDPGPWALAPSPPPPPPGPPLTLKELAWLGQSAEGDLYGRGVVSGPAELAARLGTDLHAGLCEGEEELAARAARYGANALPAAAPVSFWALVADALRDFTVLTLIGAGAGSLALSLAASGAGGAPGADAPWLEGASILASVGVVVAVGAGNNWQKERQFRGLAQLQRDYPVRVLRGGAERGLSTAALLVGDLVLVQAGDVLPADGALVAGAAVRLDQSMLTGEAEDVARDPRHAPLLLAGSRVVEGQGRMLVTAVGERSAAGAIARDVAPQAAPDPTQLQLKLEDYARSIGQFGVAAAGAATLAILARTR